MPGPIVCGVDDSSGSRDAVATALTIAARAELPLLFVHVAPDEPNLSRRDPERKRRLAQSVSVGIELLERATSRAARGRGVTTRVGLGDPAKQLAAVAASTEAGLLIVGSRGRRTLRAALLGSVSRAVIALSDCPVLVVPPGARLPEERPGRERRPTPSVLCGIDGSPEAIGAAVVASRLAGRLGDRLVLAHAHPPLRTSLIGRYHNGTAMAQWSAGPALLHRAADSLGAHSGPQPELTLEPGDPQDALARAARRESTELLVLGSHPDRPALRRSVAGALVRSSPTPVLLVPPAAARAATGQEPRCLSERSAAA